MRTEGQEHDLVLINDQGVRWGVRVVREGDRYGLDDCLIYEPAGRGERFQAGDPLVEFYDLTYTDRFGPRGQFVSRYYTSTLAARDWEYGLDLDGGIPAWSIDREAMRQVRRLIDNEEGT